MVVDVTWDGVPLASGAQLRDEAHGWFVAFEQPMPVGTTLQLSGGIQALVRVTRVHEGLGAGMLVQPVEAHDRATLGASEGSAASATEKGAAGASAAAATPAETVVSGAPAIDAAATAPLIENESGASPSSAVETASSPAVQSSHEEEPQGTPAAPAKENGGRKERRRRPRKSAT